MIDEIQHYWNHRIHDLEMTDQPVGTKAFFDDLDDYRFDKLHYLPQLVDFSSFKGQRLLEVGCGIGTDLVRFAQGGARVTGVDLAQTAIDLARKNFELQWRRRRRNFASPTARRCRTRTAAFDVVYGHGVIQYTAERAATDSRVPSRAEAGRHGDLHGLQPRVVAERDVEGDEGRARARGCAGA